MPFFRVCFVVFLFACSKTPSAPLATITPPRQFILHDVMLQERDKERVVWSGTMQKAEGDMLSADAFNIRLTRYPKNSEQLFHLNASSGVLSLNMGNAELHHVRFTDATGNLLQAPVTFYNDEPGWLLAFGPLIYTAQGMTAHAMGAVVYVKENRMDIMGPIAGQMLFSKAK